MLHWYNALNKKKLQGAFQIKTTNTNGVVSQERDTFLRMLKNFVITDFNFVFSKAIKNRLITTSVFKVWWAYFRINSQYANIAASLSFADNREAF